MIDDEFSVSEETLLSAFKYALGRKRYVVSNVVRDISQNADLLSSKTRQYMLTEINARDEMGGLGERQDRAQWDGLRTRLNEAEAEIQ